MDFSDDKGVIAPNTAVDKTVEPFVSRGKVFSEPILEPDQPHFEFVENITNPAARSHAMKTYWNHKKNELRRQEDLKNDQPALRPLASKEPWRDDKHECSKQPQLTNEGVPCHENSSLSTENIQSLGIPDQLFAGISFTFAFILDQRAAKSSIPISTHHYRFFYHCEWTHYIVPCHRNNDGTDSLIYLLGLSMHADVIHSGLKTQTFTPFKDIWMPLDLSNAASFNGILAHAAADLFGSRLEENRSETLKYKTEAIGMINKWLSSTVTAMKDEVFAGVVRLLTFEVCRLPLQKYSSVQRSRISPDLDHPRIKVPQD